jgi:hypothetical protein
MWAQGFLPEVLRLRAMPGWHENAPAMRCVGYRQAWAVIDHWHAMGWTDERLLATLKAAVGVDPLPPSAKNFFMQHPEADLRQGLGQSMHPRHHFAFVATPQLQRRPVFHVGTPTAACRQF